MIYSKFYRSFQYQLCADRNDGDPNLLQCKQSPYNANSGGIDNSLYSNSQNHQWRQSYFFSTSALTLKVHTKAM